MTTTHTYTEASDLVLVALAATSEAARASERFAHGVHGDYTLVEAAHEKAEQAQAAVFEVLLDLTGLANIEVSA